MRAAPPPHVRDVVEGGGDARAEDVQVSAALVVLSFLLHAHQQHEVVSERPRHGLRLACHEDSRPHEQCDDQRGEWAMGGGGEASPLVRDTRSLWQHIDDLHLTHHGGVGPQDAPRHACKVQERQRQQRDNLIKALDDVDSACCDVVAGVVSIFALGAEVPPCQVCSAGLDAGVHFGELPACDPDAQVSAVSRWPRACRSGKG